ncbi:hypothetical protein Mal15_35450 [Stieleria maiorica]|uniref:Glycosyltransferase 2-like prokaryotic type domain-containing protein n=2 Tax=Stieleria maiorica TaxID=2795974 RepID=A0A5B9MHL1_9BACT|nr:hypothetical protein Mal15_35450 [Stieleria maiorica]
MGRHLLGACFPTLSFRWSSPQPEHGPAVSVLVAIGGEDRQRLLVPCLASLFAAAEEVRAGVEIILVREGEHRESAIEQIFPEVVECSVPPQPAFNKSLMLNVAARKARGEILVIHDADLLVSPSYLTTCLQRCRQAEAARPGRLIFYLNDSSTDRLVSAVGSSAKPQTLHDAGIRPNELSIERVVQNTPNPMAVRRETYFSLGGHDEDFEGWGGEDLEFLSRLRTTSIDEFGSEPLIHLWHPPSPKKQNGDRNQQLQDRKLSQPPQQRVRLLVEKSGLKWDSCGR